MQPTKLLFVFQQAVRRRIRGAVHLTLTLTLTLIIMVMRHGLWVMGRVLNLMDCAFPEQDFQLCQYHSCHMLNEFKWLSRNDLSWAPHGRSAL